MLPVDVIIYREIGAFFTHQLGKGIQIPSDQSKSLRPKRARGLIRR